MVLFITVYTWKVHLLLSWSERFSFLFPVLPCDDLSLRSSRINRSRSVHLYSTFTSCEKSHSCYLWLLQTGSDRMTERRCHLIRHSVIFPIVSKVCMWMTTFLKNSCIRDRLLLLMIGMLMICWIWAFAISHFFPYFVLSMLLARWYLSLAKGKFSTNNCTLSTNSSLT